MPDAWAAQLVTTSDAFTTKAGPIVPIDTAAPCALTFAQQDPDQEADDV